MTEIQYLWEHWKFNADQRIKAFNFFVVFSIFANGGLISAIDKKTPAIVLMTIGAMISILAVVFFVIDVRSERLIRLAEPGLRRFEETLPDVSKLFHVDSSRNRDSLIRYKYAFRALFLIQCALGGSILLYAALMATGCANGTLLGYRSEG